MLALSFNIFFKYMLIIASSAGPSAGILIGQQDADSFYSNNVFTGWTVKKV